MGAVRLSFLAALFSAFASLFPSTLGASSVDWPSITRSDVEWMFQTLEANHPGFALGDAPLVANARKARELALSRAKEADGFTAYYMTLRAAANSFQDVHVSVTPKTFASLSLLKLKWPGFRVAFPNGTIDSGPLAGRHILSCDGLSLSVLFNERVSPLYGIEGLPASQVAWGAAVVS